MNTPGKIKTRCFLMLAAIAAAPMISFTQVDYKWWNDLHNWDGQSQWHEYIRLGPAYMGPNALPVPEHTMAEIIPAASLETSFTAWTAPGDKTLSSHLRLSIPVKEKVQIDIYGVPVEIFSNDSITRDLRRIRYLDSRGHAYGDIYFSTNLLLWHQQKIRPDLSFRFGFKTASGGALGYARFTDTPAYFFDLSAGKNYFVAGVDDGLRVFAMAGFFAWQTYDPLHPQNDAFVYGIGARLKPLPALAISADCSGYSGYLDTGDRPLLIRLKAIHNAGRIQYFVNQTFGLRDYPYYGLNSGIIYIFGGE